MLAKQCWRLIDNYDSLCAKVLRSKYHPSGDLLNCNLKKGSSYAWQSISSGIQTLKKGCIWRVGNRLKINIWEDCWIPNSSSRKIITARGNCVLTTVNELISPVTGEWDEALIRDAERILQIPIFQHDIEDFIAWHLTKSGIFSVRSTYYRHWEECYESNNANPVGIRGSSPHPVWKKLWNLKVQGKVKNFL